MITIQHVEHFHVHACPGESRSLRTASGRVLHLPARQRNPGVSARPVEEQGRCSAISRARSEVRTGSTVPVVEVSDETLP